MEKSILDYQLDYACEKLNQLIKSGKILPDYNKIWHDFARERASQKAGFSRKKSLTK